MDLWAIGLPILIADIANPVLLAGVILGLSAKRPIGTSCAVVIGHTVAYFMFGILIVFGLADLVADLLSPLTDILNNPEPWHYVAGLVIGLLLIVVAWRWRAAPPKPEDKQPERVEVGLPSAFLFGAAANVVAIPFALPYFAFINQIYELDDAGKATALVIYNLFYALPFLLVPAGFAALGEAVMPLLERVNRFVEKASGYLIPVIFGALGIVSVIDALVFFATGQGLF